MRLRCAQNFLPNIGISLFNAKKNDFLRMCSLPGILHIRKDTQKSKFLLSQAFKWKKNMFFVIPEINFCYALKKLPDHFNYTRW